MSYQEFCIIEACVLAIVLRCTAGVFAIPKVNAFQDMPVSINDNLIYIIIIVIVIVIVIIIIIVI